MAKPIKEFVKRFLADTPFSELPKEVTYWKPAIIIEITATKPPMRSNISNTAKPTAHMSLGKLKVIAQLGGVGWVGRYSHQLGRKKKEWLQVAAAKYVWLRLAR